ncbi:MAG: pyridoxal 5'-phosphate synthase glutaminase subunit PdxT [Bacteroidales bacterium]|nr:pyridoxal 5'-phosphate synthase glutaminase subunit PdxT [Bacteroidales bacterium]MCI7377030.1 pyridoxal 5'-phosphate synthase glutaminase subunit PdxT [Bacteroidales bacterium]
MKIAILALQGAFEEHQQMLHSIGVDTFLVRNLNDWQEEKDGLILPGGESTAMMRIMNDEGLFEPLRSAITSGLPVFGTCAGLILLDNLHLNTMNIEAKRNAYGRQLGSFHCLSEFDGLGVVPMTFIRAPYIAKAGEGVSVLATVNGNIVAARQENQLVTAFHPELDTDTKIHEMFVNMCR